jgi:hypothetical protein
MHFIHDVGKLELPRSFHFILPLATVPNSRNELRQDLSSYLIAKTDQSGLCNVKTHSTFFILFNTIQFVTIRPAQTN